MLKDFSDVYVVIDALDECDDKEARLHTIETLAEWSDTPLHLLITSRKERDIVDSLRMLCNNESYISVQSAVVNEDIRTYVHGRLQSDRRFTRWRSKPAVQSEIADDLVEKADGMYDKFLLNYFHSTR